MTIENRIEALARLGDLIAQNLENPDDLWKEQMHLAEVHNPWFTQDSINLALRSIGRMLNEESLKSWMNSYPKADCSEPKTIAVIMAGNLPLVGFHDFLSVLITGNRFQGKLSSKDTILLPWLAQRLIEIEAEFAAQISFVENRVADFDAIIATGSNNSARYFETYFSKYPNIIRKNRSSVAILTGEESVEELQELAKDIFDYFGLGCRSVNKVYLPEGYEVSKLIDQMQSFDYLFDHNKFNNNYSYNRSVFLLNLIPFLDNGFSIFKEDTSFQSPISVVHYEFYKDINGVKKQLEMHKDEIQCVVKVNNGEEGYIAPGQTQFPGLSDYADNVDVISFLQSL